MAHWYTGLLDENARLCLIAIFHFDKVIHLKLQHPTNKVLLGDFMAENAFRIAYDNGNKFISVLLCLVKTWS